MVQIGISHKNKLLVVVHAERGDNVRIITARKATKRKGITMKVMNSDPDLLEEYDFSKGARGKYAKRYAEGTNLVLIDPDVAEFFPDHDTVNEALRSIITIIKKRQNRFAESGTQRF